jgi:hypothetical protein
MAEQSEGVPQQIVRRFVNGIRRKMDLNEVECYESVQAAYIEGQVDRVIQVVPGSVTQEESPSGGQTGGGIQRRFFIQLSIWYRLKTDMHGHSANALTEAAEGFMDYCESIRDIFSLTVLGGLVLEPIRWENETQTVWYDLDNGILRRDVNYSATYREVLPTTITMTEEDCADL